MEKSASTTFDDMEQDSQAVLKAMSFISTYKKKWYSKSTNKNLVSSSDVNPDLTATISNENSIITPLDATKKSIIRDSAYYKRKMSMAKQIESDKVLLAEDEEHSENLCFMARENAEISDRFNGEANKEIEHMVLAFYVSCTEMIDKWENMVASESSCEVDVWPYLSTFSADVISRTSFGSSFEEGRKIFELQREQAELVIKASNSFYLPGSRFLPTKSNKRMKEIDQEIKSSIKSIINNRVVAMKAGETSKDDLLGILLDSNYNEIEEHGNNKFGLSIDEVIEECKLFYFAGQETTGNLLVWTMILLGQYTYWQTHAREEVLNVFGDQKPDIDGLSHLKVINMIFNEVLRLYPPAVLLRRLIHEETKLGNLTLPAGTLVQINTMILQHDKDAWGEDVLEFKPERFSEGVSKATKGQATYIPFGGGPRICIGQNFAMLEAKMALSMILQRFSFELSPSYSHGPHAILTMQPQFGAHLILHKR